MEPAVSLPIDGRDKIPTAILSAMDDAMTIASQSPMGRRLLESARDGGLHLRYDPDLCDQLQAGAGLDPRSSSIFFGDVFDDPMMLAITLCHEARHYNQLKSGLVINSTYTPVSMLKMALASEADARAHQIQVGLELALLKNDKGEARFSSVLNELFVTLKEIPGIADIFDSAVENPGKLSDGRLMKECFEGFYASGWLRRTYEDVTFAQIAFFPESLGSERYHVKTMTSAEIVALLDNPLYPYLKDNFPADILDKPFYAAVDPETKDGLRGLRVQRGELTGRDPGREGWSFSDSYTMEQSDPYTPPTAVLNPPPPPSAPPRRPSPKGPGL